MDTIAENHLTVATVEGQGGALDRLGRRKLLIHFWNSEFEISFKH